MRQRPKQHQSRTQRRPRPDRGAETLSDVLDVMLHVLLCTVCPLCNGHGSTVDGTDPSGKPRLVRCPCRHKALELLEEFDGMVEARDDQEGP